MNDTCVICGTTSGVAVYSISTPSHTATASLCRGHAADIEHAMDTLEGAGVAQHRYPHSDLTRYVWPSWAAVVRLGDEERDDLEDDTETASG